MCGWVPRLGAPLTQRIIQKLPALACDAGSALDCSPKAVELSRNVVERGFHLAP